jgi:hypothetical protein
MIITPAAARSGLLLRSGLLMSATLMSDRADVAMLPSELLRDVDVSEYAWRAPATVQSSTSFLASHLEQCYARHLERLAMPRSDDPCTSADSKVIIGEAASGEAHEAGALSSLSVRLPRILRQSGAASTLWGVRLDEAAAERSSLLAIFLRARDWNVDRAESFLLEMLTWRREQAIDEVQSRPPTASKIPELWPDDIISTARGRGADGQPHTFVVVRLGRLSLRQLQRVEDFVAWRIRQQERACLALSEQWRCDPRGPKYTLVLDCAGLGPRHFGRVARRAIGALSHTLTHYYPDFVHGTLVVNAPGFVKSMWAVLGRLTPAWWGVRMENLAALEKREGVRLRDE